MDSVYYDLIMEELRQERKLRAEQLIVNGLNQFDRILKDKDKDALLILKIHLLQKIQDHPTDKAILEVCMHMINMINKRIKN